MQRSGIVDRITKWEARALVYIAKRDGWEIETTDPLLMKYTALPAITLKNIPNDSYDQIRKSASLNYRSINSEILYRLHHSLGHKPIDPDLLLKRVAKLQRKISLPKLTDELLEKAKTEGRP